MIQLQKLCENIGYSFQSMELLRQALCHRSVGKPSNERLEFLGDSILNFVIASELFYRYPDLDEGELSRLRANLVNGELLAQLAREMNIGEYIYLGVGEAKSGGGERPSILANTVEAIIGAIYLDANLDMCRMQVLRWYDKRLDELAFISHKDSKTKLQELIQSKKMPLPIYKVVKVVGAAHAQIFHIECKVNGVDYVAMGEGGTKRKAEQNAAKIFFEYLTHLEDKNTEK